MFNFTNMSVRMKALSVFVSIGVFIAVLATTALLGLTRLEDRASEVRDNWLPGVDALSALSSNYERLRAVEAAHIIADTPTDKQVEEKSLAEIRDNLAKTRAKYGQGLMPGFEAETFAKLSSTIDKYLSMNESRLIGPSRAGEIDVARDYFRGEGRTVFRDGRALLKQLVDYNSKEGAAAAARGQATYSLVFPIIAAAAVVALLVCLLGARTVIVGISRPVLRLTERMRRLADRDLTVEVEGTERGDEVGAMARAVGVFKEGLIAAERMTREREEQEARRVERVARMERLIEGFDTVTRDTLRAVSRAATDLDATARGMSDMARRTNTQASTVATAAEQMSAGVQTAAAATEEMSAAIGEIGGQVARSTTIARRAVAEAEKTNQTVRGLSEAAGKVGEVIGLINDIASQTNLLALNATIEAARAGEAGKGFAVVAGEVKSLAAQTARATEEISDQIGAITTATDAAVAAIREIGGIIHEMSGISSTIAAAVEEQSAATVEISRNVQQAALGAGEVSSNIASVNAVASETGVAAARVLSAAGDLAERAGGLHREVGGFLASIRAA